MTGIDVGIIEARLEPLVAMQQRVLDYVNEYRAKPTVAFRGRIRQYVDVIYLRALMDLQREAGQDEIVRLRDEWGDRLERGFDMQGHNDYFVQVLREYEVLCEAADLQILHRLEGRIG